MATTLTDLTLHRGSVLHFLGDPGSGVEPAPGSYEFFEDGVLAVADGKVVETGVASELLARYPRDARVIEHTGKLLLPGFIDTHIHYPQTDVIACGGTGLLDWLRDYTFPAERRFADIAHAREVADFFLDELIRNGTTTALVFCTVHPQSAQAFFESARARQLRMIAGKVLMDRHCPDGLRDTAESGEAHSRELIEQWHGQERLLYALTPRFAGTSSTEQLASVGRLAREFPDVFIQTHAAENLEEVQWIRDVFPDARSYMDVYDRHGLLRDRAIYAHCIHVDRADRERMAHAGAAAAFCPSSNLYLGSGLFDIEAADAAGLRFSIATDVGGGNHFSLLQTMGDAYKVAQLSGKRLPALRAFYLATAGAARVLRLEHAIGDFRPGSEADFIVLYPGATPLLARRFGQAHTLSEKLLVLLALADQRAIAQTWILGCLEAKYRNTHPQGPPP
ncbi:MAG TPA: guanine deaminase [Steroidobacteraceae bacterium]|jgi:guanine deaminase